MRSKRTVGCQDAISHRVSKSSQAQQPFPPCEGGVGGLVRELSDTRLQMNLASRPSKRVDQKKFRRRYCKKTIATMNEIFNREDSSLTTPCALHKGGNGCSVWSPGKHPRPHASQPAHHGRCARPSARAFQIRALNAASPASSRCLRNRSNSWPSVSPPTAPTRNSV
jgi:hypothetical protein